MTGRRAAWRLVLCLCLRTVALSCAIDGYYGEGRRDFYFFERKDCFFAVRAEKIIDFSAKV